MDYKTIRVAVEGVAGIILLSRPEKKNAITFEMMDEIEAALRTLGVDGGVRGIIIAGAGDCFSTGMDLNSLKGVISTAQFLDYMQRWQALNTAMENHAKPIIAAIEGYCITGGFELALACDLRVGAEGSQYGITSSKIGTVPGAGGTQRLPRIVGTANALDILFSSEFIDAQRAREIGLLSRLTPKGEALAMAKAMVDVYATRAPLSLRFMKQAVYGGMQMPLTDAIRYEAFVVSTVYQTEDKQEGINAFLEKRPASFKGR